MKGYKLPKKVIMIQITNEDSILHTFPEVWYRSCKSIPKNTFKWFESRKWAGYCIQDKYKTIKNGVLYLNFSDTFHMRYPVTNSFLPKGAFLDPDNRLRNVEIEPHFEYSFTMKIEDLPEDCHAVSILTDNGNFFAELEKKRKNKIKYKG